MEFEIEVYEWIDNSSSIPHSVKVRKKVELTEEELAAAIMADSIGYASPNHAMMHVRDYKEGKTHAYCERGSALFNCDLKELIMSAVYYWYHSSEEKRERLRRFAEQWKKVEERNPMAGTAISMMYPTLGV